MWHVMGLSLDDEHAAENKMHAWHVLCGRTCAAGGMLVCSMRAGEGGGACELLLSSCGIDINAGTCRTACMAGRICNTRTSGKQVTKQRRECEWKERQGRA